MSKREFYIGRSQKVNGKPVTPEGAAPGANGQGQDQNTGSKRDRFVRMSQKVNGAPVSPVQPEQSVPAAKVDHDLHLSVLDWGRQNPEKVEELLAMQRRGINLASVLEEGDIAPLVDYMYEKTAVNKVYERRVGNTIYYSEEAFLADHPGGVVEEKTSFWDRLRRLGKKD